MLNLEELKNKYQNKKWYNSKNEIIIVKDITEYTNLKYKLVYEIVFNNPIQYLNDISEFELTNILNDLRENKTVTIKSSEEISKNDLENLKDKLFMSLNDLLEDSIDCNKANAICKISQTILNLEKIKQQMIKPNNLENNPNQ
jgi:F0F1-type ATP synthase delta subunit